MNSNFFTLGTASNTSAKRGEEGVHYVTLKDNQGIEYKILNIESEIYAPRQGIVEIEPLKNAKLTHGGPRHLNNVSWKRIRDQQTGYLVGIPTRIDPKSGEIIWQPLNVQGMETFDLSIPSDRAKWICVKYSHFYIGSPNFTPSSKTKYKAIDRMQEATDFELSRRSRRKASELAESLHGDELAGMAIMLGFDPQVMSPKELWMHVVKFAENPDKVNGKSGADRFLEVFNSPTKHEFLILRKGISTGVISHNLEAGINYGGLTLGFTEAEATQYLKDHPQVAVSISAQSESLHAGSKESMKYERFEVNDEKDAIIANLKKQLEEQEEANKRITEKALEVKAQNDLINLDSELADLHAEAHLLKIRNYHVIKDKEKLKAKIAEAKKTQGN